MPLTITFSDSSLKLHIQGKFHNFLWKIVWKNTICSFSHKFGIIFTRKFCSLLIFKTDQNLCIFGHSSDYIFLIYQSICKIQKCLLFWWPFSAQYKCYFLFNWNSIFFCSFWKGLLFKRGFTKIRILRD